MAGGGPNGRQLSPAKHSGLAAGTGARSLKNKELSSYDLRQLELEANSQQDRDLKIQGRIEEIYVQADQSRLQHSADSRTLTSDLLDISPLLTDAAAAIVDDSFLRCFQQVSSDPWNWNAYLLPAWLMGVVIRYCILFPIRVLLLMGGFVLFFLAFFPIHALIKDPKQRAALERTLVQWQCRVFVASWTGVVRYHGPRPVNRPNHVWVCNHTSMIDYIILTSYSPFAVIMQLHAGWIAFLQTRVLSCLGCLWFNRNESKDRKLVGERMKAHVAAADTTPLLIFPEGTCVNNEYCVMFKRGAFDLGATVCPVAIRYNKIFVDAFWNSRRQSFTAHLLKLMTSWAVVCDVYFLEPTAKRPGESAQQFAERVQQMIAQRANLRIAPWDGYLKYYNLSDKHPDLVDKRRTAYARMLLGHLDNNGNGMPVMDTAPDDADTEPGSPEAAEQQLLNRHRKH